MDLSKEEQDQLDRTARPSVLSNDRVMRIRIYILIELLKDKK